MARILTVTLNPALDLTVRLAQLQPGEVNRSPLMLTHADTRDHFAQLRAVIVDEWHELLGTKRGVQTELCLARFKRRGFVDAFIRVPGETRSNIKLAEDDGRVTDLNGPGPQVGAQPQQTLLDTLERIAPGHDAVVVAGSLPRGVSPQWLHDLLLRLKGMGLKVILDTSGEALKQGLAAGPWLIKPNSEELSDALGSDISSLAAQIAAASRLQAQGVEHVVISHGAEGVNWFSRAPALQALPPKVSVASTVGAGDSLLAGMVHGLLSGHSPEQTLRTATAIAAMAVTQIGFGISDAAHLATLESGVRVRPLTEE